MNKRLGHHLWRLLPGVITAVAIALLLQGQAFQPLEQMAYRTLFELRGPLPADQRLVVIAIDDASLKQLGRFPWPRHYYTQLLAHLPRDQASVVVMNVIWSEPSPDDAQLAEAIQQQGVTVLAQAWDGGGAPLRPVPTLEQAAIATGHIMRQEDTDGLVRQLEPLRQGQPALAVAALQAYNLVAASIALPDLSQPLWLNWPGPADQVSTYSFVDVLQGRIPTQTFRNKIVLVGVTAAGLDPLVTPFDRNPPTSGLYLHATALDNLLQGNFLQPLSSRRLWWLLLVSSPGFSWLMSGWNTRQQLMAMAGLCGGWAVLSLLLFQMHLWLPTAAPVTLFVTTAIAVALSDRLREDYLLRRQVAYLWHHYHQDLVTAALSPDRAPDSPPKPPLPRTRGAVSQVVQLADLARQLGRSQSMQIAIARTLPTGLIAFDGDGTIWFCNPVAIQLFQIQVGSSADSAVVPHWLNLAQWQVSLENLKLGNTTKYSNLYRGNRWFDLSLQPLPNNAIPPQFPQSSPGFLLLLEEITEHKQAEAALQRAKEAALREAERSAAASRAKGDFLAHMSHELRTPLNVILGFTQVISHDQSLHIDHRTHLKIINRSGQHLLGLINDVLEMSKIEAGRVQLNKTRFDLYHLLNDLEAMVRSKAQAKHLRLTFAPAADLPRYIATDEGKLRQILLNLIGNAIKFTEAGSITLRVNHAAAPQPASPITLSFEVEDTGIGIATDALGQLFQPFTQSSSGQHAHEGTGLGLAISHTFVRLMGGNIMVCSTVNQGSTFKFHIQADLAEAPSPMPSLPKGRVISLAPEQPAYRILIVEDQWENSQLLVKLLTPLGFELRHANHGQDGVTLWKQWCPHLILMDLRMPIMGGIKATQIIRAIEYDRDIKSSPASRSMPGLNEPDQTYIGAPPLPGHGSSRTKIIALTASTFEETKANAIAIGCDDFLRKPIQEDLLLDKLSEHLNIRYLYQSEDSAETPTASVYPTILSAKDSASLFLAMSKEWTQELHDLAVKGADSPILKLIAEIPDEYSSIAQVLTFWVENFQFEKIIQITHTKP
ncbi:CHASE2 domain-containing protein [Nodosilinea nodulosa]|uniref:CHASE2 domain-containing protein n=1 Tax=Nodosilinea nodulosa TaxID=416001 RepID=UPI00036E8720|nr:CHASE2 domain-containing protein [Nodosilinea nodulosa]